MYARIPTTNISNTVARTIAIKLIKDLKSNLSIDDKAFIALENILEEKTFTSGINVSIDKNEYEVPLAERITAKIDNSKINEYTVGNPINDCKPLFLNDHISISTEFINYEMVISISYRTRSKVNAEELVNYLKDHAISRGSGYIHNVDYYYLFPSVLLGLLEDIFTTGKINVNDDKTFIDFLKSGNIMNAIVVTSDINGYQGTDLGLAAIATNQIHGLFDVDIKDAVKEFDTDTNTWTVPVTYKVNYMSPESLIVDYALLVNNSMLPNKYYIEKANHATDPNRVVNNLHPEGFIISEYKQNYMSIPPFDNHKVNIHMNNILKPILSVLVEITPTDLKTLFNLSNLYYYVIKDEYLEYMKLNYLSIVKPMRRGFDGIFTLDIYDGNRLLDKSTITIDELLNISSVLDLDITRVYRVVLSVVTDFTLLTPTGLTSIKPLNIDKQLDSVITSLITNDYRIADTDKPRYITPIDNGSMLTAQTSTIKTFFK